MFVCVAKNMNWWIFFSTVDCLKKKTTNCSCVFHCYFKSISWCRDYFVDDQDSIKRCWPFWTYLTIQLWSYPSATLSPATIPETMLYHKSCRIWTAPSNENAKISPTLTILSFLTVRLKSCGNSSEKPNWFDQRAAEEIYQQPGNMIQIQMLREEKAEEGFLGFLQHCKWTVAWHWEITGGAGKNYIYFRFN